VGRERALVSDQPGTTRDYLEERIILGDHCLRLIDTAGLNAAPAELEKLGMEKSLERMAEADLILLVLDSSKSTPELPETVRQHLSKENTLLVANKSDLGSDPVISADFNDFQMIATSAHTGAGFDDLQVALQNRADAFHVELGDDLIAINARHADALARANSCLGQAMAQLKTGDPIELIASELRGSLAAYGEISGKIDNERMLDYLFASFCIGK